MSIFCTICRFRTLKEEKEGDADKKKKRASEEAAGDGRGGDLLGGDGR